MIIKMLKMSVRKRNC
ncbi:hypothetical protein PS042_19630 [Escherichia albertii]|uniref:Uncharacterized protein n=1 Tax=Escherichia albertii TaxID=208962 RepID=A0A9Q7A999_ESCAL|nr:hypothetical protein [Escherichia albertii]EHK6578634.1 hypothetical protein [Escherichia albertii]EHQ8141150.1 hypothetical protein [Escherichia albertii]EHW5311039.1 hypothetical protein [Escherichia albertii]EHW5676104.1 hypothetical protein [Escherichia albertii]EHW5855721.1 hypothetical protein [Escherichia albertii]